MGQDSGSIELKSEEVLDLKLGAAPSVAADGDPASIQTHGPGVEIAVDPAPDLELKLSPERVANPKAAGGAEDATSVVDLGEDLLERTAVISRPGRSAPLDASSKIELPESMASAVSIGMSPDPIARELPSEAEGVSDFSTPAPERNSEVLGHSVALNHVVEAVSPGAVTRGERISNGVPSPKPISTEELAFDSAVMSRFEHQLIDPEFPLDSARGHEISALWESLVREFGGDAEWDGFVESGIPRNQGDRVDLGISYLEMGAYHAALREFEAVRREDPCQSNAVVPLQAQALLHLGRPFEALSGLESVLGDPDIKNSSDGFLRSELQYWAARCCEALGRNVDAALWLQLVVESDSDHRDAQARLRGLSGGAR